jgi:hypothetical protein
MTTDTVQPYDIQCRFLAITPVREVEALKTTFSGSSALPFRQTWNAQPCPAFRPACVWTGWNASAVMVFAELHDDHIFNPATGHNARAFEQGDVFEMFFHPAGQDAYYEIHIGPSGQLMQLRFPHAGAARDPDLTANGIPPAWFIETPIVDFETWVDPSQKRWHVYAEIPLNTIQESTPVTEGDQWKFSFSRYDYSPSSPQPAYSSTSPHRELDYHRIHEYGTLTFNAT